MLYQPSEFEYQHHLTEGCAVDGIHHGKVFASKQHSCQYCFSTAPVIRIIFLYMFSLELPLLSLKSGLLYHRAMLRRVRLCHSHICRHSRLSVYLFVHLSVRLPVRP